MSFAFVQVHRASVGAGGSAGRLSKSASGVMGAAAVGVPVVAVGGAAGGGVLWGVVIIRSIARHGPAVKSHVERGGSWSHGPAWSLRAERGRRGLGL